jgi:hypothetical protein
MCAAPIEHKYRPFCSKRCADLDLAKWFNGGYATPVVELDERDLDELEAIVESPPDEWGSER